MNEVTEIQVTVDQNDVIQGRRGGMHPSVVNGRRTFDRKNTAKPRSKRRMQMALEGWDRHIANHPKDGMAARCRSNLVDRIGKIGG